MVYWKKLTNLDNEKYQLGSSNKIFIIENLSRMNENIIFDARKLKRRGATHGCLARNGVVHIKLSDPDKGIKNLHKSHFCEYILDYEEEEEDLFHDVSQEVNNSVQSSYWENLPADYFLRWLDYYELFSSCGQHLLCYEIYFWNFDDKSKKTYMFISVSCFFYLFKSGYSVFKFNSVRKIGYLMLCFYLTSVQLNVFRMSFSSCFFFIDSTPQPYTTKIPSWNYVIKFRKLKMVITIHFW